LKSVVAEFPDSIQDLHQFVKEKMDDIELSKKAREILEKPKPFQAS